MSNLKTCMECGEPAYQNGGPSSFVRCSSRSCPIRLVSIPVSAWQSWPRRDYSPRYEVVRLQNRLEEFENVHQKNLRLIKDTQELTDKIEKQDSRIYRLERELANTTKDRDIRKLEIKKVVDWAVGGAQASWAAENTTFAQFYEELLELMGKRDATKVPCFHCGRLPIQHVKQPGELQPKLSCPEKLSRVFTPVGWMQHQRAEKLKRTTTKDQDTYKNHIRKARNRAVTQGNLASAESHLLHLLADISEHMLGLTKTSPTT